jgi:ELWxxDGT repeat protein
LWVTDGTTAGTSLVKDINPGTESSYPFLVLSAVINNKFYFQATTAANGAELWVSDGTAAGTTLLKDINPGAGSSDAFPMKPYDMINGFTDVLYNGKIFLSATDPTNGSELWMTDGTAAGTTLVKDINPGVADGVDPFSFTYFYSTAGLYFAANSGAGVEPYLSNGTSAGTTQVADVNVGPASSEPFYMFVYNNQLYFNATNGDHATNTDLYKINGTVTPLPVSLMQFTATLLPAAIQLNWSVAQQVNVGQYEVQRSVDGSRFIAIGSVAAALTNQYTFADAEALKTNQQVLYYRLRIIDKDGAYKYSTVVKVNLKKLGFSLALAPVPAKDVVILTISGATAGRTIIEVVDLSGRTMKRIEQQINATVHQQLIDISQLAPGNYVLRIVNGQQVYSQQFTRQ